jgi:hypothetical protein
VLLLNILKYKKEKLFFFLTTFVISLLFTKYYFLYTHEYYPPAQSDRIANFEADKVFQKRFLVPVIANTLSGTASISFDHSLKFIVFLSTMGIILGFKEMMNIFVSHDHIQYISLSVLLPISWNYIVLNSIFHAYDIPAICLYCWGVVLFMRNIFLIFYILFIISTLNRESSCFITISILLLKFDYNIKDKKNYLLEILRMNKFLFKHIFFQFIIWLSLVFSIKILVNDNPGSFYEKTFSMLHFIKCLIENEACWPYLDPDSFFYNPRCFLTLFLGLWILIPLLWHYIPSSSKKLLLVIPIYMIPCIMYANLMETRVYHEINVIISLVSVLGFYRFYITNTNCLEVDHS